MKQIHNVSEFLKSNDIKPSYQRLKIFKYLIEKRNHPTVETIYSALIDEIPTLSKTTVYNTMKLFIDKNIVSILTIDENESRFDADTDFHGHFLCIKCGSIYDVDLNSSIKDNITLKGMYINEHHIYLKGNCNKNPECLNK